MNSAIVDSGTITTPISQGGNVLGDQSKTWAIDVFQGYIVKLSHNNKSQLATIRSNTGSSLSIYQIWIMGFPIGSSYEILLPGPTQILCEFADVAVNTTAPNTPAENNILNLAATGTRYIVRHLRLKCANPGANTVTVILYELVDDTLTRVDSFDIDATNFDTYHSLMDMFGLVHLAGDRLQVTVQASAGGPYAVTSQYSYASAV